MPTPPDDLLPDARAVWDKIVPVLDEIGIIDTVDEMALEAMCTTWARAKQAGRIINEEGPTSWGSERQPKEHPACKMERDAMALFMRFAEQYALTPVARTRLGLAELQRRRVVRELESDLGDDAPLAAVEELSDVQEADGDLGDDAPLADASNG